MFFIPYIDLGSSWSMGSGKKWSNKVVATLGLRKNVLNVVQGDGIHVGAVIARCARNAILNV